MKTVYQFLFFGLVLITNNAYTNNNPITFNNKNLEQRYYSLIEEIRCLVCQNQSLADSDAPLAQDLRNEIYKINFIPPYMWIIWDFIFIKFFNFTIN